MRLPSAVRLLKILGRDKRFIFGLYRRHMKVIGYLGTFDRLFGVPVTTRNWNTITAIARVLGKGEPDRHGSRRSKAGATTQRAVPAVGAPRASMKRRGHRRVGSVGGRE